MAKTILPFANGSSVSMRTIKQTSIHVYITKDDLLLIGKSIKHKKAAETIEEIIETVSKWKTFADEVKVCQG